MLKDKTNQSSSQISEKQFLCAIRDFVVHYKCGLYAKQLKALGCTEDDLNLIGLPKHQLRKMGYEEAQLESKITNPDVRQRVMNVIS